MESRYIDTIENSWVSENNDLILKVIDRTGRLIEITFGKNSEESFKTALGKWKTVKEKRGEIEKLQAVIEAKNLQEPVEKKPVEGEKQNE